MCDVKGDDMVNCTAILIFDRNKLRDIMLDEISTQPLNPKFAY